MLDSFFNKGFKAAKCKTLLKLTIPRIKLLRNRREIQLKQMRKDIANLLANGQEATARIRVEHIIREENMMAAQDIIELFCELITVRLPIIEIQRECPLDLKEAISSICFAAPRCADLPELLQVQLLFAAKYGKEFVAAATELMPDCGVNRQIIELLSVRAPSAEIKVTLLKQIAEEHEVDWDPAATESEFLKPHEDLLNGPGQIISGSSMALPLPKEKQIPFSKAAEETSQESGVDPGLDSWDLPEVPKSSVQSNLDSPPEEVWTPPLLNSKGTEPSSTAEAESKSPNYSLIGSENNQFVPFVPPPLTPAASSPSFHAKRAESAASPPPFEIKPNAKEEDLQDVLAAAQAAAESAERAAAAARAAASLAQLRFAEISKKKKDLAFDGIENEASDGMENPTWSQHKLPDDAKHTPLDLSSQELLAENKGVNSRLDYNEIREPQRSISMEDDPYYSYPNLFSRQESFLHTKFTSSDNSQQAHDT